jgi:hypothetical protein
MDEVIIITLLLGYAGGFLTGWFLAWIILQWDKK